MLPTIADLHARLLHLLPAHHVDLLHSQWAEVAGEQASDSRRFIHWLQKSGHLTRFQMKRVLRNRPGPLVLGQYRIVDRLGKGDLAKVYKARAADGSMVALKTLPPSRSRDRRWLRRFEREARLMCRLDHPHIIRALAHGVHEDIHFLVMEYVEGETLEQVLQRRKKLRPLEAARLLYQTLLGLQYLFENGLAHGNLKPANLLLAHGPRRKRKRRTAAASVKLLDIGLGPAAFKDRMASIRATLGHEGYTRLDHCADYLAPELARDPRHYDIRADIFSLGCILYRALTGELPFPERNGVEQIIHLQTGAARPLREVNPDVPDALQAIAAKMLAPDPAQRFSTPQEALQALAGYLLLAQGLIPAAANASRICRAAAAAGIVP